MSIQLLTEVEPKIKYIKDNTSYNDINISDLKIDTGFKDTSSGYTFTDDAVRSLASMLGIPNSFFTRLCKDDEIAWTHLTNRLKQIKDKESVIYVDNDKKSVINVFPKEIKYISASEIFDQIQIYVSDPNNSRFQLKKLDVSDEGVMVEFIEDNNELSVLPNDIFKTGFSGLVSHSNLKQTVFNTSLLRLVCTNMTYIRDNKTSIWVNNKKTDLTKLFTTEYLEGVTMSNYDKIVNSLRRMKNCNMSLAELEGVYKTLYKLKDCNADRKAENVPLAIKDLDQKIRLEPIYSKYGLDEDSEVSYKWKTTASTPYNTYDVYNYVTENASHNKNLHSLDQVELKILGGQLIMNSKDLDDVAPTVTWDLMGRN